MVCCVTGMMAAGKNYFCSKLEENGFVSLDMDKTVHEAIAQVQEKIFSEFKDEAKSFCIELKNPDGSLNRRNLGKLIFPRPELLKKQESIVYPKVIELVNDFVDSNCVHGKNVVLNATVLYKIPELMNRCEKIYFVTAPFFKRLLRAKRRDKIPVAQILARFKTQKGLLSEYQKTGISIEIIKN